MTSNSWTCADDFEWDLYELSNIAITHLPKPAPTPSKYMLALRGKSSIYVDIEEDPYERPLDCIPVRGYPVNKCNPNRPGAIPPIMYNETNSMIREVAGFGYCNNLIEHALKNNSAITFAEKPSTMPNLAFQARNASPNRHLFKVASVGNGANKSKGSLPANATPKPSTPSAPICKTTNKNCIDIYNKTEFPDLR